MIGWNHLDRSAHPLDQPSRNRKTEAGTASRLLRREEGLEDPIPNLLRDAGAVIAHLQLHGTVSLAQSSRRSRIARLIESTKV